MLLGAAVLWVDHGRLYRDGLRWQLVRRHLSGGTGCLAGVDVLRGRDRLLDAAVADDSADDAGHEGDEPEGGQTVAEGGDADHNTQQGAETVNDATEHSGRAEGGVGCLAHGKVLSCLRLGNQARVGKL